MCVPAIRALESESESKPGVGVGVEKILLTWSLPSFPIEKFKWRKFEKYYGLVRSIFEKIVH